MRQVSCELSYIRILYFTGVDISLELGADLHMAQLMPLPLSCCSKIQIGFTFLVPAYPGLPFMKGKGTTDLPFWYRLTQVVLEKRPLNGCSVVVVVVVLGFDSSIPSQKTGWEEHF